MESELAPGLRRLDAGISWVVDHWLALFNGFMGLYITLPLAAPLLSAAGARGGADVIYATYSLVCHQIPSHSWFILGQQMAYCQRDTALYLSMFVGGLLYARWRLWTRGLPFWGYLLLALPIAVDGGTGLVGFRESTPLLRTLTGGLFGFASAWFVYPLMDRALIGVGRSEGERAVESASGLVGAP